MPLSLFHHDTLAHYREEAGKSDGFGHTFGGDPSSFGIRFVNWEPLHLLYRLNQHDPAVSLKTPCLNWLPLCYHFSFASLGGTLIYRVLNDGEIELISPLQAEFDAHFPYRNYPRSFPQSPVVFRKQKYDPTVAEDALELAAVFGVDHLSPAEMQRAIKIADETSGTISDWGKGGGVAGENFPDWSSEELVRYTHRQPFMQGAPQKSCDNPQCTAEIAYHAEELTIEVKDGNFLEVTGQSSLTIPAHDVRRDSMRVFALHHPDEDDKMMGREPFQLIYEVCECCHCIRVSNQCT